MNIIENINKTVVPEMDWTTEKNISYTQLSAWSECPHKWKMMYIEKMKQPKSTQHKKKISNSISVWWEDRKQEEVRHGINR